ncbi:tryptophan 2,3-dioxygenase (vermilion) [Aequorivita sublithincola DSM 14238]|uniref:Tryptophan 2,3-dioxygenase (Vermilion) n=1 Tax=Aequorivita sublithincola (strain DSM 14238 / LMG 21431 / ACAM 643 / 9-3) TaxID=746697 RepID=I3YT53_AEQSU|nr:tryptophan 2,3-dioxygenase family protein [Aequorivita sublithincola]AFL80171.1 tryptophan 2,3-dioxygenase (vermilion) [Aequorivita sublithincola DSM 14238]
MDNNDIIEAIKQKYIDLGENPETYFKGLLQAKPINYWDYIQVDTLLSLQKTRTDFKDEEIFVMYHQVTELTLKMMIHEIKQLSEGENLPEDVWMTKLDRLKRYTRMLITSFDIMKDGMNYDDYNVFRSTLTPASGFQSASFRYLELYCTKLENLINSQGQLRLPENPTLEDYFENIYWKDAGYNRKTGQKTLTLRQFIEKYEDDFKDLAEKTKGKTLEERVAQMENPSEELKDKLKQFDHFYNVAWPLVHLDTANHYLTSKGVTKAATGGSEWQKYLHPKYQQRKFFPELWSAEEIATWGE